MPCCLACAGNTVVRFCPPGIPSLFHRFILFSFSPAVENTDQIIIRVAHQEDEPYAFQITDEMARSAHDVRVAMAFTDHDQAKVNASTRATLARGDAPGQGGTFPDRFTLGEVAARGSVVTMDLRPVATSPVLSDLSTGPLLFATC